MQIDENDVGQRLDHYLQKKFRKIPKVRVYRAIRKGEVRINGKRAKPDRRLDEGDQIRIPPPFMHELQQPASSKVNDCHRWQVDSAIIFENDEFLCLNKPSGMAVHAGSGISMGVIESLREQREGYYELAHRLDRATSGCLLIAKKASVLKVLASLFHDRKVKKTYKAKLSGTITTRSMTIDLPLRKVHSQKNEHRSIVDKVEGKAAVTKLRVLSSEDDGCLVELMPMTGRMHQLRAHCAAIGHPILGDSKYAQQKTSGRRLHLHASSLAFTFDQHAYRFEADCPFA